MDINKPSLSRYKSNKSLPLKTQSEVRATTEASRTSDTSSTSRDTRLPELKEGQLIKGQILDHRYNEVTVQIEPGKQLVKAKLTGDIPLSIGQDAQFVVTEEGTDRLVLKYLPAEAASAAEDTIRKALTASGLPLNERNKTLVEELLNHRMPIDKQTLQLLAKLSVTNREVSPITLVLMHKNHLPMTAANLKQFEAYQNGTHQLLNNFRSITDNLIKLLQHTSIGNSPGVDHQPSKISGAKEMNQKVLDILLHNSEDQSTKATTLSTPIGNLLEVKELEAIGNVIQKRLEDTAFTSIGIPADLAKQIVDGKLSLGEIIKLIRDLYPAQHDQSASAMLAKEAGITANPAQAIAVDSFSLMDSISAKNAFSDSPSASLVATKLLEYYSSTEDPDVLIADILKASERSALLEYVSGEHDPNGTFARINDGIASLKESLEFVQNALLQADTDALAKLLTSVEYRTLLEEAFLKKWTLTPEKLAKKAPLSELYQRLQEDLTKLDALVKNGPETLEWMKLQEPIKNTQENLQFLKSLNEMFTYIQLPVQLKNKKLHSDLYVFTRKKALNDKRENISVLLHLDMENLGPLNIHLQLNHRYIQAKFYIEDGEAVRLVEDNLPNLEAVLQKKGYQIHTELERSYEKPDFIGDFIERSSSDQFVQRYTFDIRT